MEDKRYFLPSEVVLHNKPDDIWVSFLGKVYDVTEVVQEYKEEGIAQALLASAGKDISDWFDERTRDLKKVVHPITGLKVDYVPHRSVAKVSPPEKGAGNKVRWVDKAKELGYLTKKARPVRVINALASEAHRSSLIWVAAEETLGQIAKRIEAHNSHVGSYTLKCKGKVLHLKKTLDENGIPDERDKFLQLGMTDDHYIPVIVLHFNDDLTKK